jgi:hypothetical protein
MNMATLLTGLTPEVLEMEQSEGPPDGLLDS